MIIYVGSDFRLPLSRLLQENEATLLARGKNIKTAIDIALIAMRNGYRLKSPIKIYDELLTDGTERYISAINIEMVKEDGGR